MHFAKVTNKFNNFKIFYNIYCIYFFIGVLKYFFLYLLFYVNTPFWYHFKDNISNIINKS